MRVAGVRQHHMGVEVPPAELTGERARAFAAASFPAAVLAPVLALVPVLGVAPDLGDAQLALQLAR